MKEFLCILNSNALNRYGYRFTTGALVSGTYESQLLGAPHLVAHDHSRRLGWLFPTSVYVEPGLARAAAFGWIPETDDDRKMLKEHQRLHHYKTHIEPNLKEFRKLDEILKGLVRGHQLRVPSECVALYEPGLAKRTFPQLFVQADKDGLIPINSLDAIGPGIYKFDDLVAFAHYYFRRNLYRLNSLNYPLLGRLQALPSLQTSIAIDPDMVGLSSTYRGEMLELQYWWGPKFNDDLTSIPTGVTRYEGSENDRIFFGLSAMEFRWGTDDKYRIFECEELRDLPSAVGSQELYGCRYAHSMVDLSSSRVVHLDGAIRAYSEEKMIERLAISLDKAPRDTDYTKLWRTDGTIPIGTWKSLLSDHYRDNFLIGEYFGEKEENVKNRSQSSVIQPSLTEEYVPYSMTKGSGVRVALAFSEIVGPAESASPRVISLDSISVNANVQPFVEGSALELKKALNRRQVELTIAPEIQFVVFKDRYTDFPLVYHYGDDLSNKLSHTLSAIKELVDVWINKNLDMVVAYKIGFPVVGGRVALISVMGHIEDMRTWLASSLAHPPLTVEELKAWADHVSTYLSDFFPHSIDSPPLSEILMNTGVLLINRRRIAEGEFETTADGLAWTTPKDQVELVELLEHAGIRPALGMLLVETRCTRCEADYRFCECSKTLDADVGQEIISAVPFVFWTDRPLTPS